MSDPRSGKPEINGGDFTMRSMHAYFSLWLSNMEKLDAERDRRYEERHVADEKAVGAALAAAEKAVGAALTAQQAAVTKAEESQKSYNAGHNDLQRKMEEKDKITLPRPEADARFKNIEDKIDDLRLSRSEGGGRNAAAQDERVQSSMDASRVLTIAIAAATITAGIVEFILRAKP